MNQKKSMPQSVRTAITALNTILVLLGLTAVLLLSMGTLGARSGGTFSLFGRSFHLNQSDQMSPMVEKGDLVMIRNMAPTSFQMGNLIAYYQQADGKDYLIIRELVGMVGSDYYLEDGEGNQTIVAAGETRFLGRVESRSPRLGLAVQFLQSREGKNIYLWWTASLLFLLIGIIVLLHVILKNLGPKETDEEVDYGIDYLEAEPSPLLDEEQSSGPGVPFELSVQPEPAAEETPADAGLREESENVSENSSASALISEEEEDEFDLSGIISDIQAQLDSEEKK
ncbi:MAG: hypothetical protein PUC47_01420 [Oscillospiraceae bacterium]|nr:hypothetical protein [Oscillospiraceae bacterium]